MTTHNAPEAAQNLDLLGAEAVGVLRKFLQQPDYTSHDIGKAKMAMGSLASWAKIKQTESARESNFIMLARELAEDKQQFRKLVSAVMPGSAIVKALPAAKDQRPVQ